MKNPSCAEYLYSGREQAASIIILSMNVRRLAVSWLPAILWMGFIFYLSAQSRPLEKTPPPPVTVLAHLGEYALLAVLLLWAQLSHGCWRGRVGVGLALSFAIAVLYAASDEYHQGFVPGREASWVDLGVDAAGAAAAMIVMWRWGLAPLGLRVRYQRKVFPAGPKREGP